MVHDLDDLIADIDLSTNVNPYLATPQEGLTLVGELLSQEGLDENELLIKEIKRYLENEFIELVSKDAMPDEGVQIMNFYHACEKLSDALRFPVLESKHVFAIGGGFSSGKSSFVNVLLGNDILPTATCPTTSIPTVICYDKDEAMGVVNSFDKQVNLNSNALKAICHEFHSVYGLGFAGLLKQVLVTSPRFPYPFAAFLDTPGYNKSEKAGEGDLSDRMLAKKQLEGADYLIWLINIKHGTIPQTDIAFINGLSNRPQIFFVMTMADEKTKGGIASVLKKTQSDITNAELSCAGILPFSAQDPEDYSLDELNEFVRSNSASPKNSCIRQNFADIFDSYEHYYELSIGEERQRLEIFNKVALSCDLTEDDQQLIQDQIRRLQKVIKATKALQPQMAELKEKVLARVDQALVSIESARRVSLDSLDATALRKVHETKRANGDVDANRILVDVALRGDVPSLKQLIMHLLYKEMFGWDLDVDTYLSRSLTAMKSLETRSEHMSDAVIDKLLSLTGQV